MKRQQSLNGYKFSFGKQQQTQNGNTETPTFVSIQENTNHLPNPSFLTIKNLGFKKRKPNLEIKIDADLSSAHARISSCKNKFSSPKREVSKNMNYLSFDSFNGKKSEDSNKPLNIKKKPKNKMRQSSKFQKNKDAMFYIDKIFLLKKNLVESTLEINQKQKQDRSPIHNFKNKIKVKLGHLSCTHQTKLPIQSPKSLRSVKVQNSAKHLINFIQSPSMISRQLFPSQKYKKQTFLNHFKGEDQSLSSLKRVMNRKKKPPAQKKISKIAAKLENIQIHQNQIF